MPRLRAVVLLVGLLLTAGCGGRPTPPTPAPPTPVPSASAPAGRMSGAAGHAPLSGVDVLFLTMMVAHTEQTLEIVRLGRDRVADAELRTLVAAIEVTESDELDSMRAWLREAGPPGSARRHDHSGHSDAVAGLARLRAAPPADVDRVLLAVLDTHQRTAADLARAHLRVGTSDRVRDLAGRVERSRTAEVALMAGLPAARR